MHTNPPPPPYTHSSSPSSPSSSPPITQTVATSAELTELLLLRTQMREFINPILDHTPQLSQQTEQIALLEMKNQQLQTQMQMLWTEFDRRREEGHATGNGNIRGVCEVVEGYFGDCGDEDGFFAALAFVEDCGG
ncbi:hypothetical protein BPOR_0730g00090 [Botrytis porri]|uniref:Uncharacterized protein n=1 Tax=Botrytis porri TaxID=87229 RepID=A0A4Z1KFI4_9HELO|nr:hypothetical protein BPOR_0730g00090 [Botrytis porri]